MLNRGSSYQDQLAQVSGAAQLGVDPEALSAILDQKIQKTSDLWSQTHAANMATFNKYLGGQSDDKNTPKKPFGKPTLPVLNNVQLTGFGDFAGTTDVNEKARYLGRKGLFGADQLIADKPENNPNGVTNAQSSWKTSAMSAMLMQARRLGIKTPTEVSANKSALIGALDPRFKDAINTPEFSNTHPNWWQTFDSILKDQYDKEQNINSSLAVK